MHAKFLAESVNKIFGSSVQFNLFATLCIYGHQQINKYFIWPKKKTNKQYNIPSAHKHTAAGMATNRPLGLQVKQPPLAESVNQ